MRHVLAKSALAIILLASTSGCVKRVQTAVPAFAQAVTLSATNVQSAFDTVQRTYYDAEVLSYATNYVSGSNEDPSKLRVTWLPPEAIKARQQILEGLKQYASELASLTTSNNRINPATTALSASLKSLASDKTVAAKAQLNKLPDGAAGAAVNAIATWIVDEKVHRALPAVIENMNENIQHICAFLVEDIGRSPDDPAGGSGLRDALWNQYTKQLVDWDDYVQKNYVNPKVASQVSPELKLAAIKQIVALATQRKTADQTLAQVAETIKKMAQAHANLEKAATARESTTAEITDLYAEAQRLSDYYQTLTSSK